MHNISSHTTAESMNTIAKTTCILSNHQWPPLSSRLLEVNH